VTAGVWTERFPVRSYEVTPGGRVSVLALADYLQEAAGHHAAELGVSMQDLLADGQAWVLAHLRLELDRLPRWGETVVVRTWPSGLDRLFATREFLLEVETADGADATIARGTSAWLTIDTERRRPLRPLKALRTLETPDRDPALAHDFASDLPVPDRTDAEDRFSVRYHDLDVNRHVNNVRYLEWALETLPGSFLNANRCTALSLQFEAETTLGDRVRSIAQIDDGGGTKRRVHHQLMHAGEGRALARAVTTWTASG